jgi:site-specific recombinase XerD
MAAVLALASPAPSPRLIALPNPDRPDVDAMFREFIRTNVARADAAPATVRLYLREARAFREYLRARDLELRDVTPRHMREWVRTLVELGRTPATIATKIVAVRRLLAAAVDAAMLAKNPAEGIQGPKERRETGAAAQPAQRTLSLDEVRMLLATAPGDSARAVRDRALLALLVGHGLRIASIATARASVAHSP